MKKVFVILTILSLILGANVAWALSPAEVNDSPTVKESEDSSGRPHNHGLATSLGDYAGIHTFFKGTNNAELLYYDLTGGRRGDVTVESIKFAGYVDGDGAGNFLYFTHDPNENVYIQDIVTSLKLFVKEGEQYTQIGNVQTFHSSGFVTFNNLNYTIPAGQTKTLVLKGDISSALSSPARLAFDIFNTHGRDYNIVAYQNGRLIRHIAAQKNGSRGNTNRVLANRFLTLISVIITGGNIYAADNNSPVAGPVVAGTADVPVLNLRFSATDESFRITHLRIKQINDQLYNRSVDSVKLYYTNEQGQTVSATQILLAGNADFYLATDPIFVPADISVDVAVVSNLNQIAGTIGAYAGDILRFAFDYDDGFEAVSDTYTKNQTDNMGDIEGNTLVVYKTYPIFAKVALGNDTLIPGYNTIYKFSVTASEGTAVTLKKINLKAVLNDSAESASFTLDRIMVKENGTYLTPGDTGVNSYRVYDGLVSTSTQHQLNLGGWAQLNSQVSGSQNMFLVFNDDRMIPAATTKVYTIIGNVNGIDEPVTAYSLQTYLAEGDVELITDTKYLTGHCNVHAPNGDKSKYCLAENADTSGMQRAVNYIWSDTSGTDGNGVHVDTNGTIDNSSKDWFNAWGLNTLGINTASTLVKVNN
ncbi:hypothetical protein KKF32_04795 [Patescibacteria group bacterium]|nr:hypothetical protein [Patescibacteria group bacterium]